MTLAEKLFFHMYTTDFIPAYQDADMVEAQDGEFVKRPGYYLHNPHAKGGLGTMYKCVTDLETRQAREAIRVADRFYNILEKESEHGNSM